MSLNDIDFTEKDVEDFMNSINVDALLKNIDEMPNDDNYESSFSHDADFYLTNPTVKDNKFSYQDEITFIMPKHDSKMELIA